MATFTASSVSQVPQSINAIARLVRTVGPQITVLVEGEPGCGKSSILKLLKSSMGSGYEYVYLDCPTLGDGDLGMNIPNRDTGQLEFFVSSLLKLDSGKPLVIMLDEFLKCDKLLKKMFTRLMLEREIGDRALPADSIVFATSNNASDGVGDTIEAHVGNRIMRVQMAKPNYIEWSVWARNAGLSSTIHSWVQFKPKALHSYRTCSAEELRDNEFIYNPAKPQQVSFVSPRSLEKSDHVLRQRHLLGDDLTLAALSGLVGVPAAESMMMLALMEKEMTPIPVILADPSGAPVPASVGAVILTLNHSLDHIKTQDDLTRMLQFTDRLKHEEFKAVFYTMLCRGSSTAKLATQNAALNQWYLDPENRALVRS